MKAFCSWSGGKDSCVSSFKAILEGHRVEYLFTMFAATARCTRSHRLSRELILAQSQAIGIPLHHRRASWNTYETEFRRALAFFKRDGAEGGVFGNIHISEQKEWVENACAERGIIPLFPLWGMEAKELLLQFIEAGFKAAVVAVNAGLLDTYWLGREIDEESIKKMEQEGVDICGEKGEYHTVVVSGPIFKKSITIRNTRVFRRNKVSFLELLDFEVEEKDATGSYSAAKKANATATKSAWKRIEIDFHS